MDIVIIEDSFDFAVELIMLIDESKENRKYIIADNVSNDSQLTFFFEISSNQPACYLVDLEINGDMTKGFQYINKIKANNPDNEIIIITKNDDLIIYNFEFKHLCANFILKDNPNFKAELHKSLKSVYELIDNKKYITIPSYSEPFKLNLSKIYYIEKVKNRGNVTVYYENNSSDKSKGRLFISADAASSVISMLPARAISKSLYSSMPFKASICCELK